MLYTMIGSIVGCPELADLRPAPLTTLIAEVDLSSLRLPKR